MFVTRTPNSNNRLVNSVGIFLSTYLALAANIKAITSIGHLHLISQLFGFGDSEGDSLSYVYNLFFSNMPNPRKKVSKANNSTLTSASVHDTDNLSFRDLLVIIQSELVIEKNAKNKAYAYILSRGLLKDFAHFSNNEVSDNPHSDCIDVLPLCATDDN